MSLKNVKLLIDVGLGRKVEKWMEQKDYDSKSIRDIDPRMPDVEILRIAVFVYPSWVVFRDL